MTRLENIDPRNEELALKINRETRSNPVSEYAGKYVGIARGQVVAADEDLDKVLKILHQAEPDRSQRFVVEASADYDTPCEIWSN